MLMKTAFLIKKHPVQQRNEHWTRIQFWRCTIRVEVLLLWSLPCKTCLLLKVFNLSSFIVIFQLKLMCYNYAGMYASSQPTFTATPSMNQSAGMMTGNYNPLMQQQGNMFSSPMFSTNGAIPPTGSAQMGQLSQQLSGLNFGQAVHNPMMPASVAPGKLKISFLFLCSV